MKIDLNCDLGEGFAFDAEILPHITSANIACGYHAGDPRLMRQIVRAALRNNVSVGAHPSYNDPANFGRSDMQLGPDEIEDIILYQVGALEAIVRAEGAFLSHVKPHGALYNLAMRDISTARAIAKAVAAIRRDLIIFALPGSELEKAALELHLPVAREAFPDRYYLADGSLAPRAGGQGIVEDPEKAAFQALSIVTKGEVTAVNGQTVKINAETLCIHGDNPSAPYLVRIIRKMLDAGGILVKGLK